MTIHISANTGCNLGCTYSAVPGTRVLTADLDWVPIEDLDLEDEVLCFDRPEETDKHEHQKLRVSEVTATYKYQSDAVRVVTDDAEVTVGATHPFLSKYHGFRDAQDFKPGQEIRKVVTPPEPEDAPAEPEAYQFGYVHGAFAGDGTIVRQGRTTVASVRCQDREVTDALLDYAPVEYSLYDAGRNTDGLHTVQTASPTAVDRVEVDLPVDAEYTESKHYARGWLAGLFDTDGAFDGKTVRFLQNEGDVKEAAKELIAQLGYEFVDEENGLRIKDGTGGRFRFLSEIRPKVSRKVQMYVGRAWKGSTEVEHVEPVGERVLHDVTVEGHHTLVMEGLCSHNCYEEPDREMKESQIDNEYDIEKIFEKLEDWHEKYPDKVPGLHGGEPLLLPDEDLERLFSWIDERYDGSTSIQTNGTLLTDAHVEMFVEYDVSVGMSVDGPAELNNERVARAGDENVTQKMTERTHEAIEKLVEHDELTPGVIVVLSETNAGTDERLKKLLDWMDWLCKNGASGHYNPAIPYPDVQEDISLSPERLKEVYLQTYAWTKQQPYRDWDPMSEFKDNLLGNQLKNCVVNRCDVFNAGAAKIIKGDGSSTGCGKTWATVGDGTTFLQGDETDNAYNETEERYEMLKQLPGPQTEEVQEGEMEDMGGCKGCRYWNLCQGGCPSSGLDNDYRNRTRECKAIYALYEAIERDLRGMFPGIRLVTDAPWDFDIASLIATGEADIKPFGRIRQGTTDNSGTVTGAGAEVGTVVDELQKSMGAKFPFEKLKEYYQSQYPDEMLTMNRDTNDIHADSAGNPGFEPAGGESEPADDD